MTPFSLCKVRDTYRSILSLENYFEEHYDLNLNEAMLLCTLSEAGQLTAGEIADRLSLSSSNASKVLSSVERKQFVVRSLDHVDKRKKRFSLTSAGAQCLSLLKADPKELTAAF